MGQFCKQFIAIIWVDYASSSKRPTITFLIRRQPLVDVVNIGEQTRNEDDKV